MTPTQPQFQSRKRSKRLLEFSWPILDCWIRQDAQFRSIRILAIVSKVDGGNTITCGDGQNPKRKAFFNRSAHASINPQVIIVPGSLVFRSRNLVESFEWLRSLWLGIT